MTQVKRFVVSNSNFGSGLQPHTPTVINAPTKEIIQGNSNTISLVIVLDQQFYTTFGLFWSTFYLFLLCIHGKFYGILDYMCTWFSFVKLNIYIAWNSQWANQLVCSCIAFWLNVEQWPKQVMVILLVYKFPHNFLGHYYYQCKISFFIL